MRQTAKLYELATAREYRVHAPADPEVRGGTIAIDVPHGYEVCQELLSRDIIVDYRPGAGIRIAPHFYTLDSECEAVIDAIDDILESRAYERFVGKEHKPG